MNAILIIALLVAGILTIVGLASVALVTLGIRREERRMDLFAQPRNPAEIFARSVLGVYVRQPYAPRVLSTQAAISPGRSTPPKPSPQDPAHRLLTPR
jgi:hypothetical protein